MILREVNAVLDDDRFGLRLMALEMNRPVLGLHVADAAQRSEEVEMPESTAEFAVRHGSKAVLLFLFDEVGNAFVLELREILTRKLARMEGLAGFKKALGTKKAADDVGTVRGIHAGHGNFSLMKNEGAAILPPPEVNVWIEIIAASRLSRVPLKGKIARL